MKYYIQLIVLYVVLYLSSVFLERYCIYHFIEGKNAKFLKQQKTEIVQSCCHLTNISFLIVIAYLLYPTFELLIIAFLFTLISFFGYCILSRETDYYWKYGFFRHFFYLIPFIYFFYACPNKTFNPTYLSVCAFFILIIVTIFRCSIYPHIQC